MEDQMSDSVGSCQSNVKMLDYFRSSASIEVDKKLADQLHRKFTANLVMFLQE